MEFNRLLKKRLANEPVLRYLDILPEICDMEKGGELKKSLGKEKSSGANFRTV